MSLVAPLSISQDTADRRLAPLSRAPQAMAAKLSALRRCPAASWPAGSVTWSVRRSDGSVVDLVPGGRHRPVRHEERAAFCAAAVSARLLESSVQARFGRGRQVPSSFPSAPPPSRLVVARALTMPPPPGPPTDPQIEAIRSGLEAVVPRAALALLTWRALEHGVCGQRTVPVAALRAITRVDLPAGSPLVAWFWQVLEEFRRVSSPMPMRPAIYLFIHPIGFYHSRGSKAADNTAPPPPRAPLNETARRTARPSSPSPRAAAASRPRPTESPWSSMPTRAATTPACRRQARARTPSTFRPTRARRC